MPANSGLPEVEAKVPNQVALLSPMPNADVAARASRAASPRSRERARPNTRGSPKAETDPKARARKAKAKTGTDPAAEVTGRVTASPTLSQRSTSDRDEADGQSPSGVSELRGSDSAVSSHGAGQQRAPS